MADPVTRWYEITQYDNKIVISIANLFETTWLTRYPIPMEILYGQGSEFIGHKFRKSLIDTEYWIANILGNYGNPTPSAIFEQIHQVLGI